MTALSPPNAWTVGQPGSAVQGEHWDGSSWTLMPAFSGVPCPSLKAAAARSAADVWAIGSQVNQTQNALLLHWDGGGWSTASSPAGSSALCAATTTVGGGRVWAFGTGTASQPPVVLGRA